MQHILTILEDRSEEIKKYIRDIDHLKLENKKLKALLQASEDEDNDKDIKDVNNRLLQITFDMESKLNKAIVHNDGDPDNSERLEKDVLVEPAEDGLPEKDIDNVNSIGLPVYKPSKPVDPSDGRDDWCGLCERSGHSSINCPYENDIF